MKSFWSIVLLAALAGCAASEKQEPQGPPAQVTVYREPSSADGLFPMIFAIDGQSLGQLYPGDEQRFEVPAGNHSFEYIMGVYDCASNVALEPGETHLYRLARGCVIERVSDRGAAVASKADEPGGPSATTWAAENRNREALEDGAKDDRFTIWRGSGIGNAR